MPRLARLDAPGLLQHVMARPPRLKAKPMAGRQEELKEERSSKTIKTVNLSLSVLRLFLKRPKPNVMFTSLNAKQYLTGAWALIPNHFLCGAPHKKCYVKQKIM